MSLLSVSLPASRGRALALLVGVRPALVGWVDEYQSDLAEHTETPAVRSYAKQLQETVNGFNADLEQAERLPDLTPEANAANGWAESADVVPICYKP